MYDLVLLQPPDEISIQPTMYFPLSLLYLGASAKRAGYSVKILDCREAIPEIPKANFYGFSAATPQIKKAKELAKQVGGITIIGGAHASLNPEDCIDSFDCVLVGEGEYAIPHILGHSDKVEKGIIHAPRISDLDALPFPDWDAVENPFSRTLFPGERYGEGELAATLIGSRGCRFNCSFCGNVHNKPVIYRSVDNIIAELKELMERGIRYFRFEDDNFTIHPEFQRLCEEITELDIHYKCHSRSDLMTNEKAEAMKTSGCEECGIGVESADKIVLDKNHKRERVRDHMIGGLMIKNAGMRLKTYFVAGLPGETDDTYWLNKDFVRFLKPDKWTLSTFTPYPGCDIYKNPKKYDIEIINKDWADWGNYCKESFVHVLKGQTSKQMWKRYQSFYNFLNREKWRRSKLREGEESWR